MLLLILLKYFLLLINQALVITHVGMIGAFIMLPAIGTPGDMQPYSSIKGFFSALPASPRALLQLSESHTAGHAIALLRTLVNTSASFNSNTIVPTNKARTTSMKQAITPAKDILTVLPSSAHHLQPMLHSALPFSFQTATYSAPHLALKTATANAWITLAKNTPLFNNKKHHFFCN